MNSIINKLKKLTLIEKLMVSILSIFIVLLITNYICNRGGWFKPTTHEGFIQEDKFLFIENNNEIYDDFYVDIYDYLTFSNSKNNYEITEWKTNTQPSTHSIILDIGCGRGHHVSKMAENGFNNVIGIDKSHAMVNKAKELYPNLDFQVIDALKSRSFQDKTFTHITCFYFTIYYMNDKSLFFKNCYRWLKSGGYLTLHLVDRDNFDPILNPANPILFISPQKYAKQRITESKVVFKDFDYSANFNLDKDNNKANFIEKFVAKPSNTIMNNVSIRKQEHMLYMEDLNHILKLAKDVGFIIHNKIDLIKVQYEYQYLYILQRPE